MASKKYRFQQKDIFKKEDIVGDMLEAILCQRASRTNQNGAAERHNFVPQRLLVKLMRTILPTASADGKAAAKLLTSSGKSVFSNFAVAVSRNGYYRKQDREYILSRSLQK